MYCKKCGKEIRSTAVYCPFCREPVSVPEEKREKKEKRYALVALITAVAVLLGACLGGVFVFQEQILAFLSGQKRFDENNVGEIYYQGIDAEHVATDDSGTMYADNEILLVTDANISYKKVEKLAKQYDAEIVGWIEQTGDYQLQLDSTYTMEELDEIASELENEDIVDLAYANYISEIESDAEITERDGFIYGEKWKSDLQNFNDCKGKSWGIEAINALGAWDLLDTNSESVNPVRVGLIDAGFDTNHEDLGFAETFYDTSADDHGTHVAGIMAAKSNNKEGICGVYPYGDGNLYGVSFKKVEEYSENNVSTISYKCELAELILRNVKVINMSIGNDANYIILNNQTESYKKKSDILSDFLSRLLDNGYDFVIAAAAGNESDEYYTKLSVDSSGNVNYDGNGVYYKISWESNKWECETQNGKYKKVNGLSGKNDPNVVYVQQVDATYSSPLCFISDERIKNRVIVVGAVDYKLNIASYSNVGDRVDIYAPGGSDEFGNKEIYSTIANDQYDYMHGTSMAAPHVAGVAAMVWSANNGLSGEQVKKIICSSVSTRCTSCRMVDAYYAVEGALGRDYKEEAEAEVTESENGGILCWVVNKDNEDEKIAGAKIVTKDAATGEVFKDEEGNPIETTTDENGHFELILPEGNYILTVTAEGYEDYTTDEIKVTNEGVNYLDDWIKMTPKVQALSESDLKNLVAAYGTISAWEYHDYDGNGTNEAFAITTTESIDYLEIDAIYYVDSEGNVQVLDDTITLYFYENGNGAYRTCEGKGFFWADMGGGGSGWETLLYSVKDGVPYELDLSRNIQGFYEDENGFYTTENEFMDGGGHLYPEVSLIYDSATQQFTKGARRDEDLTDEIAEVTTEAASDDWKSAYRQVLSSVTDSGAQFATIYIDGDEIPELVVAYDSAHAAACEIYTYYNGSAVKLKSSYGEQFGSYGGIAYKPYGNSFDSSYYGMGLGTDEIYTINNGAAQVECNIKSYEQYQGDDDVIQYWINDVETSEADYNAKLNAYGVSSMTYVGYNEGMVALNSTNMNTYL